MTPVPRLRHRRLWGILFGMFIIICSVSAQELIFKYSFPSGSALEQGVYIKKGAAIEADAQGNVYVADMQQSVILKFRSDGTFIRSFGRPGQGPGDFSAPRNLKIAENGDLIVHDTGNRRIVVLSADGTYKRSFKVVRPHTDMCVFDGEVFLVGAGLRDDHMTVDVYSTEGDFRGSIGEIATFDGADPGDLFFINQKTISCTPSGLLTVGWKFFPIVRLFDQRGVNKAAQIEVAYPPLKETYEHNLREIRTKASEPQYWLSVHKIRADNEGFWLLIPGKRIEILNCGLSGSVRSVYWARLPEDQYMGEDFLLRRDKRGLWVYILQTFPESTVNVYFVGN